MTITIYEHAHKCIESECKGAERLSDGRVLKYVVQFDNRKVPFATRERAEKFAEGIRANAASH